MAETTFVGNLVGEPEIRETRAGKPWASFTLVHSDRVKDQTGNWVDGDPTYLDCVMFAHGCAGLVGLQKGTRLVVTGRLKQQNWESKAGEKRSKIQLMVDEAAVSVKFGSVRFEKSTGQAQSGFVGGSSGQGGFGAQEPAWSNPGQGLGVQEESPF